MSRSELKEFAQESRPIAQLLCYYRLDTPDILKLMRGLTGVQLLELREELRELMKAAGNSSSRLQTLRGTIGADFIRARGARLRALVPDRNGRLRRPRNAPPGSMITVEGRTYFVPHAALMPHAALEESYRAHEDLIELTRLKILALLEDR